MKDSTINTAFIYFYFIACILIFVFHIACISIFVHAASWRHRNQLVAFGIVPSESLVHMTWFLEQLKNCPHELSSFVKRDDLLCVSDRGKALLGAIKVCLPAV
jgi:hypothetical protein